MGAPLWVRRPDRWAERRTQYLEATYDLERRYALTIAYGELGYSSSGIASRTEFAENTVSGYLDEMSGPFFVGVGWAKRPETLEIDAELGRGGVDG